MATQAQLVSHVLWRLRARASGQTPLTEDSSDVSAVLPWVLEDLAARNVIYIGDPAEIPDGSMVWLGIIVEQHVAKALGAPEDGEAMLFAESMLRDQQNQAQPPVIRADYF